MRATIGVVTYRPFDKVRKDAEAYRRLTGLRSTQDATTHATGLRRKRWPVRSRPLRCRCFARDEPRPAPSNRELPLTASMPKPDDVNAFAAADPRLAIPAGAAPPVFRANNELALHVSDPTAAAVFYEGVLGCQVVRRAPDCIEITTGPLRLFLLRDPFGVVFDLIERNSPTADPPAG